MSRPPKGDVASAFHGHEPAGGQELHSQKESGICVARGVQRVGFIQLHGQIHRGGNGRVQRPFPGGVPLPEQHTELVSG